MGGPATWCKLIDFAIATQYRLEAEHNKMHVWVAYVRSRIHGNQRNHYGLTKPTLSYTGDIYIF
jgi:hypothetical protein